MTARLNTRDTTRTTVAAAFPLALLSYAASRGARRQSLLDHANLSPALLSLPENRVPLDTYVALLRAGTFLCDDPAFALHFGESVRSHDISILGALGASFATLAEAERQVNRFAPLILDDPRAAGAPPFGVVREGGRILIAAFSPVYAEHPLLAESAFARTVVDMRMMMRARPMPPGFTFPQAVLFTHREPPYRAEYDRIFGTAIEFGAPRNAFVVDETFLAINTPGAYQAARPVLTAHAEEMLSRLEQGRTFRGRVERALRESLPKNEGQVVAIASRLGVSRQTLLRRLKAEGTTFERVLDELRQRMAEDYLSERKFPVKHVAAALGFSDATAFSRAYRRWTGRAPGASRKSPE